MMRVNYLFLLVLFALFSSCNSTPECKYDPPTPLFDAGNPAVKTQQFSLNEMSSSETVSFNNDLKLELLQSGCDKLAQEYRFEIPVADGSKDPAFWAARAVDLFQFLGSTNPNIFEVANAWSSLIELQKGQIPLDEDYPITEGFLLNLSAIKSANFSTLVVQIKEAE